MSLPEPYYEDEAVTIYNADCREVLPHVEECSVVTDPVPPGLYSQPQQGPPTWLPERPLQAADPTILTSGQVVPRQNMPVAATGDAFASACSDSTMSSSLGMSA